MLTFTVGLSLAACGSHGAAKDVDAGTKSPASDAPVDAPPLTLSEFCDGFMTANARLLSRCLSGSVTTWAAEVPAQYACPSLLAAEAAGRVTYDPTDAAACLAAYASLSCSDVLVGPMICNAPLSGTAANGASCFSDGDCGGSDYCLGAGSGNSACTGKCTPLLAAGAPCTSPEECVLGYACGGNAGSTTCISDIHPLANEGASCAPVAATLPSIQCAPGLRCSHTTKTCETTVLQGGTCTPGEGLCETFTYCDTPTSSCKGPAGQGGPCGSQADGETMECQPGLFCNLTSATSLTGTCTPLGGAGAPCAGGGACVSGTCNDQGDAGGGACSTPCTEE